MTALRNAIVAALTGYLVSGIAALPVAAQDSLSELAERPPWAGIWTGHGSTFEKLADDPVRKLSRQSEASFWFIVEPDGSVRGEGVVAYEAHLEPVKFQVPLPGTGGGIDAEVGGDAPKRHFRFGVGGQVSASGPGGGALTLELVAVGTNEDGQSEAESEGSIPGIEFDFIFTASVSIPGGWGLPGAQPGIEPITIPAKGWSPFQGATPTVEGGSEEPYRAGVHQEFEGGSFVFWYAAQQSAVPTAALVPFIVEQGERLWDIWSIRLPDLEFDLQRTRSQMEEMHQQVQSEIGDLQRQTEEGRQSVEELKAELQEERQAITEIRGELEAVTARAEALSDRVEVQQSEIEQLRTQINQLSALAGGN